MRILVFFLVLIVIFFWEINECCLSIDVKDWFFVFKVDFVLWESKVGLLVIVGLEIFVCGIFIFGVWLGVGVIFVVLFLKWLLLWFCVMCGFNGGFGKDSDREYGGIELFIFDFGIGWFLVKGEILGVIFLVIDSCDLKLGFLLKLLGIVLRGLRFVCL